MGVLSVACNAIPGLGKDIEPPACRIYSEQVDMRIQNTRLEFVCTARGDAAIENCAACVARQIAERAK